MTSKKLNLKKEAKRKTFKLAIFGSARPKPEDKVYQDTERLGFYAGHQKMDLLTGGGPGLMAAASAGHARGDSEGVARSIGLNIKLPFEQEPNESLEFIETHERFSTRLDEFMILANAVVVMPGGIGTCLELFYTWQLLQVKHICKMPIILVGPMWKKLLEWTKSELLSKGYICKSDFNFIVHADTVEQAFDYVMKAKRHFEELGDTACVNWKKYGSYIF